MKITLTKSELEQIIKKHFGKPNAKISFNLKLNHSWMQGIHKEFDSVTIED